MRKYCRFAIADFQFKNKTTDMVSTILKSEIGNRKSEIH
jgi:hypothetical protein